MKIRVRREKVERECEKKEESKSNYVESKEKVERRKRKYAQKIE